MVQEIVPSKGRSLANALIVILSFVALGPLVSISISRLGIADDRFFFDEPLALSLFLLVPIGLLVIVRFLLRWRGDGWSDIGLSWPPSWSRPTLMTLSLMVAGLVVIFMIGPAIYDLTDTPHDLSSFDPLVGNVSGLVGIIIFGWLMGGFAEEIVFRGH